jgi:DnaA family protein
MPAETAQLALPVHLRDDATLENFLFEPGPLRSLLENQTGHDGEPSLYLFGPDGCGRSHLLQAACQVLPAGTSVYLPLEQLGSMPPEEVLDGVESLSLVAVDNVQAVAGDPGWEQALFHLVNRAREQGCRLLYAADAAPRQLDVTLPDLASRLAWSAVFQLPAPDDTRKVDILRFRSARRGMTLEEEAARYILSRAPRGMTALMDLLEKLDRDSMALQRTLTIPFIKSRLGW